MIPATFHPAFVGGATLGSGLNASLLRKIQIVDFWLGDLFGATMQLVQGSPSGSSASGGTHAGPGDAGDLQLVDSHGHSPGTDVYVMASLMFRVLDCLSYVRGSDVNADGVQDDSFAQHIHVIDREGTGKVQAALDQIGLYLKHLNGLTNNHPDLEIAVSNTLTLAAYSDSEFTSRLKVLSQSAAAALAAHIEPAPEDDMAFKTINVSNSGRMPAQQVLVAWDGLVGVCEGEEFACVKRLATAADGELINARQRDVALGWRNRVSGVAAILAHDSDPAQIAEQIVASLPNDVAVSVADELNKRVSR